MKTYKALIQTVVCMQGLYLSWWIPLWWNQIFQIPAINFAPPSIVFLCSFSCWTIYIFDVYVKNNTCRLYSMHWSLSKHHGRNKHFRVNSTAMKSFFQILSINILLEVLFLFVPSLVEQFLFCLYVKIAVVYCIPCFEV